MSKITYQQYELFFSLRVHSMALTNKLYSLYLNESDFNKKQKIFRVWARSNDRTLRRAVALSNALDAMTIQEQQQNTGDSALPSSPVFVHEPEYSFNDEYNQVIYDEDYEDDDLTNSGDSVRLPDSAPEVTQSRELSVGQGGNQFLPFRLRNIPLLFALDRYAQRSSFCLEVKGQYQTTRLFRIRPYISKRFSSTLRVIVMCEKHLFGKYYAGEGLPLVGLPKQHKPFSIAVRWCFLRNHKKSLKKRWSNNDRTRINHFSGSPVSYLLS